MFICSISHILAPLATESWSSLLADAATDWLFNLHPLAGTAVHDTPRSHSWDSTTCFPAGDLAEYVNVMRRGLEREALCFLGRHSIVIRFPLARGHYNRTISASGSSGCHLGFIIQPRTHSTLTQESLIITFLITHI